MTILFECKKLKIYFENSSCIFEYKDLTFKQHKQ